jgi:hypothetical protein
MLQQTGILVKKASERDLRWCCCFLPNCPFVGSWVRTLLSNLVACNTGLLACGGNTDGWELAETKPPVSATLIPHHYRPNCSPVPCRANPETDRSRVCKLDSAPGIVGLLDGSTDRSICEASNRHEVILFLSETLPYLGCSGVSINH